MEGNTHIREADSTSGKGKKAKADGDGIYGAGTESATVDGYGHNMHDLTPYNPLPYITSGVHGKIKRSIFVNYEPNAEKPTLLPYQLLHFFTGTDVDANNSIKQFNYFSKQSYGISYKHISFSITNLATTRKRLLTTGSTSTVTHDFEDGQNLYIFWSTDKHNTPNVELKSVNPPWHTSEGEDIQAGDLEYKMEELPPNHKKIINIEPDGLPSGYVWDKWNISNDGSYNGFMLPLKQHTTTY